MTTGRWSCGSEVVMINDEMIQSVNNDRPVIANLKVTESSRVHIGPKFVSVTENVDKTRIVKDLPFHRYIWQVLKSTTKVERIFSVVGILAVILCVLLVVYFTVIAKNKKPLEDDIAPHPWFIDKEMWLAVKRNYTEFTDAFNPLRLVIIAHTVGAECHNFADCAAEMRSMQSYFLNSLGYDIPFNFLIGNDGKVYEGRGFNVVGAHTRGYNRCTLGLAFVGDYREGLPSFTKVTALQEKRAHMLFEKAVQLGFLHPLYHVLGAMDVQSTLSPGAHLYKVIKQWPHYDHRNFYRNRTCEQIQELFQNKSISSNTTALSNTTVSYT